MENGKVKALGIAPYEGMKSIMLKLAAERDDIALDVYVGDLNQGAEIAQRNFHSDYDVIISRGGTAEMIGKITDLPVIEITLSVYDILRAIKLAENYSNRYAIVGFPSITSSAHLLCDLLQYKIDIFTIHDAEEVQDTVKDLKAKGYRMLLGDMIANTTAKRLGLNAILITSGNESIQNAFDQSVKLSTAFISLKAESRFLSNILQKANNHTVVLNSDGNLFFSTLTADDNPHILEVLKKELPLSLASVEHKFFKNIEGTLYSITSRQIISLQQVYIAYYFTAGHIPVSGSKYGLKYSNRDDIEEQFFNSFYSVVGTTGDIPPGMEQIIQSDFPVMIIGESGTGKKQAAGILYARSSFSHNPFITIDCSLLNDKTWNFITNHYNSPFNDNHNTIYLCNIGSLSAQQQKQLLSIVIDMDLCKRNRVIFSYVSQPNQPCSDTVMEFINLLSCLTIHMKPLRERIEEIPTFTSLYLNDLNVKLAKQIIGFEPEALKRIKGYLWPHNYTQFKRILIELVLMTSAPYICEQDVAAILEKEQENQPVLATPSTHGTIWGELNIKRYLK
ncbi:MAG: PrpR N-terminal domain-containing protein [Hungatella sp.]